MTDQAAEKQPAGTAGAKPVTKPPEDPYGEAKLLRAQAAALEKGIPPEPGTVRLRVVKPHDSFAYGGITVGTDPVPVPSGAVPQLMAAAGDAGVTLTEEA
jgi:hypothetical protein